MKDINPTSFTLSSVIVGMIATSDLSYSELNALGNWLVLLGDYLLTYAAQDYLVNQNIQRSQDMQDKINNKNNIDYLYDAINKMKDEIEKIKRN